jgi:hypothetical protein
VEDPVVGKFVEYMCYAGGLLFTSMPLTDALHGLIVVFKGGEGALQVGRRGRT